jgi:hypothetical protein
LLAVAVNDAKTDEPTRAVPPTVAVMTMAIFAPKLPTVTKLFISFSYFL